MMRKTSRKSTKQSNKRTGNSNKFPEIAPTLQNVRLTYGDAWALASGAATFAHNDFKINSLYDPDGTGVGGQPTGFAQWMALFSRYRVRAVTLELTFQNRSAFPVLCGVIASNDHGSFPTTGILYQQALLEHIGPFNRGYLLGNSGTAASFKKFTMRVPVAALYPGIGEKDADFYALHDADPTRVAWANCCVVSMDHTTTAVTVDMVVQLHFDCEFSEVVTANTD